MHVNLSAQRIFAGLTRSLSWNANTLIFRLNTPVFWNTNGSTLSIFPMITATWILNGWACLKTL